MKTSLKTFDDFAENTPDELEMMQYNDPERFKRLVEEKLAAVRLSAKIAPSAFSSILPNENKQVQVGNSQYKTYDDFALNAPGELEKMQVSDPTRFNKLIEDKAKSIRLSHPKYFEV